MLLRNMSYAERERFAYINGLPIHKLLAVADDNAADKDEMVNMLKDQIATLHTDVASLTQGIEEAELRYAEAMQIPYQHRQAVQKRMQQIELLCEPTP